MKSFPWINIYRGLLFILYSFSFSAYAQMEKQLETKLSPLVAIKLRTADPEQSSQFFLIIKDKTLFVDFLKRNDLSKQILYEYPAARIFLMKLKWKDIVQKLLPLDNIVFIDEKRIPKEELLVGDYDLGTNKINVVHAAYPHLNGNDLVLSVKENKMDTTDIDLTGRYLSTNLSSNTITSHATIMSTIAAGGGNSFYQGKGAAWGSAISSSNFATLLPDPDAAYQQYNISVQNHSYGTGIENFYGADAMGYDASVINNPSLLHIFSAGNSGIETSTTGIYSGVDSYANITGSFKMAKNIITVGHIDSFGTVLLPSSKGPAYDGRVKPELVAFGEDGSSGATALVSGVSLLLQQAYKETHNNNLPSSALIKAILLNSADDVDAPGIDYKSGYGNLNAFKAMKNLQAERYFTGTVANNTTQNFNLTIPAGIKKLKITLVWNDPPAVPNAPKALMSDLDIELLLPAASQSWKPWALSSFPHTDSLMLLPIRKKDTLNNAEQITLDDPEAGDYVISVHGFNVATSSQSFFVTWQFDSTDTFTWYYPTGSDNIFSGEENTLRWESNFSTVTGQLEYNTDGNTWQLINNNVNLTSGFYQWTAPPIFSLAKLRMTINAQSFISDSFMISEPMTARVGFNCPDSFLLYWNKISGINNYQVYHLGDKYLEPLQIVSDTLIVLSKSSNPSLHYSVAPIIGNKTGVKSLTFNYTTQGVGCYVRTFFATLNGNQVDLNLELGTIYQVQRIVWEKLTLTGYQSLQTITAISGLQFLYTDVTPSKGVNTYRVRIELSNGRIIYSNPETVYYFGQGNYIIYPNPSLQNQTITIIAREVNDALIQIYNATGAKLYETVLDDVIHLIPAGRFSKGVYFVRFIVKNKQIETQQFVVY